MSGWKDDDVVTITYRTLRQAQAEAAAAAEVRIIKLLEDESRNCEKAGLWANGSELRGQLQELHLGLTAAIALIKGENNDGTN